MRGRLLRLAVGLLTSLAVLSVAPVVGAQPLQWEVVGEPLDPFDLWPEAQDIFLAADTAVYATGVEGIFVIRPGETTWTLLREAILHDGIHVSPTGTLFAISDGMVRSTDYGQSWGDFLDDIDAVITLPSGRLVATENGCCGIALSDDDGVSWRLVDLGEVVTPLYVPKGLAWAPPSSQRTEGVLVTVGRDGAAYSTDEGQTWAASNLVAPFGYFGRSAVYSAADDMLYAIVNGDPGDGGGSTGLVWASVDGAEWTLRGRVPTGGDESPGQLVVGERGPDGRVALWAMIPGDIDGEVFSSGDGGRTWASRGAVDGPAIIGSHVRVRKLAMGADGRLWLGTTDAEPGPGGTGAVLRSVAPVTVSAEGTLEGPEAGAVVALSVWPNPVGESVTAVLTLSEPGAAVLEVVDVLGRVVERRDLGVVPTGQQEVLLGTAEWLAGVYVVRLRAGTKVVARLVTRLR